MPRSNFQIRTCLLYDFKVGLKAVESMKRINVAFGNDAINIRDAQRWFKRFREGNENLEDMPRGAPPNLFKNETLIEMVECAPRQTCGDMAERLQCDKSTVRKRLQELGYTKKLDQWIPHSLTPAIKMARYNTSLLLLQRHSQVPFLRQIITCDEKWVLHDNSRRSSSWVKKRSSPGISSKPCIHQRKTMVTVWWNYKGIIHVNYLEPRQTITADTYCSEIDVVHAKLLKTYPAIVNRKGVILLHDNAKPHTAKKTQEKFSQLGWEVLPHPPYSPDISPTDYHLFLSMSNFLSGKRYSCVSDVKNDLSIFFDSKNPEFFENGIFSLVDRWKTIVSSFGEYIV